MKTLMFAAVTAVLLGLPHPASAACHEDCTYTCIEYYPNGTDCRKTKKECTRVCSDENENVRKGQEQGQRDLEDYSQTNPGQKSK